jgi:hypothetical protein
MASDINGGYGGSGVVMVRYRIETPAPAQGWFESPGMHTLRIPLFAMSIGPHVMSVGMSAGSATISHIRFAQGENACYFYSGENSSLATCTQCGKGYTTVTTMSESRDECIRVCTAGEYRKEEDDLCHPCPSHSYKSVEGDAQCIQCPIGTSVPYEGATALTDCGCVAGYFANEFMDLMKARPPRSVNVFEDFDGTRVQDRMGMGWDAHLYSGPVPAIMSETGYNAVNQVTALHIAADTKMQWADKSLPPEFTICMTMRATSTTQNQPFGCRGSMSNVNTYNQMGIGGEGSGWTFFSPSYRTGQTAYEPDETKWFTQCTSGKQSGSHHTTWEETAIGQTVMNKQGNCQLNFNMWSPAHVAVHSVFIWEHTDGYSQGFTLEEKRVVSAAQRSMLDGGGDSRVPSYCSACPEGTYSDAAMATSQQTCVTCPVNMVSRAGSTSLQECSCKPGYTLSANRLQCVPCAGGTYKPDAGSQPCSSCPEDGTSAQGSISLSSCNALYCPKGSYTNADKDLVPQEECFLCERGTYTDVKGAGVCTPCPAGTYGLDLGASAQSQCTRCPLGTSSSVAGATLLDQCTSCAKGKFAEEPGQAICTSCKAGKYNTKVGSTSSTACTDCIAGTYSPSIAAASSTVCRFCDHGKYSLRVGATSSHNCITGSVPTLLTC